MFFTIFLDPARFCFLILFGIFYVLVNLYANLQVLLKYEFIIQYEHLSQNGQLDLAMLAYKSKTTKTLAEALDKSNERNESVAHSRISKMLDKSSRAPSVYSSVEPTGTSGTGLSGNSVLGATMQVLNSQNLGEREETGLSKFGRRASSILKGSNPNPLGVPEARLSASSKASDDLRNSVNQPATHVHHHHKKRKHDKVHVFKDGEDKKKKSRSASRGMNPKDLALLMSGME